MVIVHVRMVGWTQIPTYYIMQIEFHCAVLCDCVCGLRTLCECILIACMLAHLNVRVEYSLYY